VQQRSLGHGCTHPEAVDACRYLAGLIVGVVQGRDRLELLEPCFAPVPDLWERQPLAHAIAAVAGGSFLREEPPILSLLVNIRSDDGIVVLRGSGPREVFTWIPRQYRLR
jgi:hypothetical protein